ncbi:MAG TPA: zf-HC2 domain-containing protein [Solirubrobacteraceae bacterium]|nr:zf-HC2 domain-containing protein [Solirubrobacteraceae bacterium]
MDCKQLVEVITAYLDHTLPDEERCRFDAHLADCPHCTEYLAQMRRTIDRLGRLDETTLPPEPRKQLLAAFRDWRA